MIARRAPSPLESLRGRLRDPLGERVTRILLAVCLAGIAAAIGHSVTVLTTPEPMTPEPVVLDAPPSCREIAPELQAERATAKNLAAAVAAVPVASSELGAVALTADEEAILAQAEVLDNAKRDMQQLVLDLAADQAATDTTISACTPEVIE